MPIRIIDAVEADRLLDCLAALAEHHNAVSLHFGGAYPSRPYEQTIAVFAAALASGCSEIAVAEE